MLIKDNAIYLNLQEAVLENKAQIKALEKKGVISNLGIKIVQGTPLASPDLLPLPYAGEYGDGYLVGTEFPYDLWIWTREDNENKGEWFDFGPINAPSTVEGPVGPAGPEGPEGKRGSIWWSQTGAPAGADSRFNQYDQWLNGANGDIYQYDGKSWKRTGNILGPQGSQGEPGRDSTVPGPQGEVGPPGPQGLPGEPFKIIGTLTNQSQLPLPETVDRSAAYIIPNENNVQEIWVIIGEDTTESPLMWHNAGSFGGGTVITINGSKYPELDLTRVSKHPYNYIIGDNTTASSNGSEVTFSNMFTTGINSANSTINDLATIELPIAASEYINLDTSDNATLKFNLSDEFWGEIDERVGDAKPEEVQILAPDTSTNGTLSETQFNTLQNNKGAYLLFNNEIYRLQDTQHEEGYLVYTHIGYNNNTQIYMIKCITVNTNNYTWVLTTREVLSADDLPEEFAIPFAQFYTSTSTSTSISTKILNQILKTGMLQLYVPKIDKTLIFSSLIDMRGNATYNYSMSAVDGYSSQMNGVIHNLTITTTSNGATINYSSINIPLTTSLDITNNVFIYTNIISPGAYKIGTTSNVNGTYIFNNCVTGFTFESTFAGTLILNNCIAKSGYTTITLPSINSNTLLMSSCKGYTVSVPNNTKPHVYINSSPTVTISGKTSTNWYNIYIDGEASRSLVSSLSISAGASGTIAANSINKGDELLIEGQMGENYFSIRTSVDGDPGSEERLIYYGLAYCSYSFYFGRCEILTNGTNYIIRNCREKSPENVVTNMPCTINNFIVKRNMNSGYYY